MAKLLNPENKTFVLGKKKIFQFADGTVLNQKGRAIPNFMDPGHGQTTMSGSIVPDCGSRKQARFYAINMIVDPQAAGLRCTAKPFCCVMAFSLPWVEDATDSPLSAPPICPHKQY
eukprot:6434580-Ditylum_brightwellii.AAC.1